MARVLGVLLDRQEVVAVADGLDEDEQGVERERGDRGEGELGGGELAEGRALGERGQHERERRQRAHRGQRGRRPLGVEVGEAPSQRADDQAEADDPVARDHHRREHGVPGERGGVVAVAGDHQRHDQPDLDHGHRDREHDRAVRLADAVRDHLGVVDGRQHGPGEHDAHEDEHGGGRLAAPGRREQDRRDHGDHGCPAGHDPDPRRARAGRASGPPRGGPARSAADQRRSLSPFQSESFVALDEDLLVPFTAEVVLRTCRSRAPRRPELLERLLADVVQVSQAWW